VSANRTPQSALNGIPGWEHATCRALDGGLSNRSYLVAADGARAVLKLDDSPRSAPFNSRAAEARVQTAASNEDLAGRVLYVDERTYLTEYLEGQVWAAEDLRVEQNLIDLANALKRVHALPLTGRTFDAANAARGYLADIAEKDNEVARHCVAIVATTATPKHPQCCHNDLVAQNVIRSGALRFLDWEYACDNDPCFDIATLIVHHELSDDHANLLLNTYSDGDSGCSRSRLLEQMRLYDALYWLWLAARPDRDESLLAEIAARLP